MARPQSNDQVEVSNRTIKEWIKNRLGKSKEKWYGELTHVLWSYRMTPKKATGQTPYSLVYETEALLPVKVNYLTIRILNFEAESKKEAHEANLDLLYDKREKAELRRKAF